jgi:hypothetical protein
MNQGESNSAACRAVGINRKTGTRWLHGRSVRLIDGRERRYPSIVRDARQRPALSSRYLSEAERVDIAEGLSHRRGRYLPVSGSTVSREIRRNRAGTPPEAAGRPEGRPLDRAGDRPEPLTVEVLEVVDVVVLWPVVTDSMIARSYIQPPAPNAVRSGVVDGRRPTRRGLQEPAIRLGQAVVPGLWRRRLD